MEQASQKVLYFQNFKYHDLYIRISNCVETGFNHLDRMRHMYTENARWTKSIERKFIKCKKLHDLIVNNQPNIKYLAKIYKQFMLMYYKICYNIVKYRYRVWDVMFNT